MPIYSFYCIKCDKKVRKFCNNKDEVVICDCGDEMSKAVSSSALKITEKKRILYLGFSNSNLPYLNTRRLARVCGNRTHLRGS